MTNSAWYIKYAPQNVEGLIFDNNEHESLVKKWLENEYVDGNLLLYGSYGLGKTITAEILIRNIIKAQNDLFIAKDRSVKEIREQIIPFTAKRPVKSKQKIVYIEEIDKMHKDAFNLLKTNTMEKHQNTCSFIACTNYIKKVESAVQSRFNYKIPFTGTNKNGITERLTFILKEENAEFDEKKLSDFVEQNYKMGIRELINTLQNCFIANNKIINFDNIAQSSSIEGKIIESIKNIINIVLSCDVRGKKLALDYPEQSKIAEDYKSLVSILHNNIDINYNFIYSQIYELTRYIPLKMLCAKYAEQQEFKMFPHINLLGFLYEGIKCICEVNRI
jgi:DNA polymerase III delta prime subunit